MNRRSLLTAALVLGGALHAWSAPDAPGFAALGRGYENEILPLLETYCHDCHDTATKKGELDLERFADLAAVRTDPKTWQEIVHQLETGEMPPKKKNRKPPTDAERAALLDWAHRYLDTEARAQAGDPGPVVLRRLNNAEYTYTIRDLTGVATLDPVREFPVDSAAGEGFTNAGGALVMSPALFEKYLEAGKAIAEHAVLLPDGFRFSAHTTQTDQAKEILAGLRAFYLQLTGGDQIDFSYRDQVRSAAPEGNGEGRVNLGPYFAALLANRERLRDDPAAVETIARESSVNSRYLAALATMLAAPNRGSLLLDELRNRFRTAPPDGAAALAAEVRAWQDRLWAFQTIGTYGIVRPWQIPVSPMTTAQEIRLRIEPGTNSVFLSAQSSGGGKATVQWQQPRFERPGRTPILLRDVERGFTSLAKVRATALTSTTAYLGAAAQLRASGPDADLKATASAHQLDVNLLTAWASYLGLAHEGQAEITDPLTAPISNGTYDFVKGWALPGVADYSLMANSSDQDVRVPGELNAHKIVVHPRPERWIAAGWKSPLDGRVQITPAVRDAHNACGNGVTWSLELRRGSQRRVLDSGVVELGTVAMTKSIENLEVRKGDLVSLVIGARDGNHTCDLTEIDLTMRELAGDQRAWSLAGDCAGDIAAGNPHSDRLGHLAVWHFYGGMNDEQAPAQSVPPGSLLDDWLKAAEASTAQPLAARIENFLSNPLPADATPPDAELHRQLTSLDGPLFAGLDFASLAKAEPHVEVAPGSERFDAAGSLLVPAPSALEFAIPGGLLDGADFVTRGIVDESSPADAVVQLRAALSTPPVDPTLQTGAPLVVRTGSDAAESIEAGFAEFRQLFPAAMCYARVVPADEVVTLQLYHRDDEHLTRLMLTGDEKARLDTLWNELKFVSREPLRLVTAYEQIWQFSTQDADPKKIEPLEAPVRERAAAFEKVLTAAEPAHLAALVDFAPTVYRRPLTTSEEEKIRGLYRDLRSEELSHEEAFRLTLARLFTTAAFLYKAEKPAAGSAQAPVSNWELATRLSYFLTSSAPDRELWTVASTGTLTDPPVLLAQTRRLLRDDRIRRLAIEFGCQWLHIRDFAQLDEKNERLFPEFAVLRASMSEESIRFFTDFFQHDRSVLSLLDADHTFVDAALAGFYGLPAPAQDWQRVEGLRNHGRGGILGLATTLASQSGASRTSPILRGNWVSETLLGEKTPKPPKDVPQLPDAVPAGLTEREMIARHTADPACAKCHARIDPYGFALEAFDAIGRQRPAADTSAILPDGATIDGLPGIRDYLLTTRRMTFVRHFCSKLLGYALGRAVQLSDEPLLDEITAMLAPGDYRVGLAVEAIVQSRQFREIRSSSR